MTRTYVVGEIGPSFVYGASRAVNERTLVRLIYAIADAGADCVKLQLKSLDGFYIGDEPWDLPSLEMLMRHDPPWIKIASASLTDHALLREVAKTGKPVVLSTGMSTVGEVAVALSLFDEDAPVTVAVCTASYPARVDDLHLARVRRWLEAEHAVGWSSHSPEPHHAALAVAAGATWIETHVTTGKERWGPDHAASLSPLEFVECVARIRECERAMGSPEIRVLDCEADARKRLRRVA
jgi:N-acetylneuraminate synthase